MSKKPKEDTVTIEARIYENIMRDWERLRRLEGVITQTFEGRDLLGEIEALKKSRDEWSEIAIKAQMPKKAPPKRQGMKLRK